MGTAAIINLVNEDTGMRCKLFCGNDGDIDGIGRDLKYMVDQLNMGWRWAYYSDDVDGLGEYLMIQGFPSRTGVLHYRDGQGWSEDFISTFFIITKKDGVWAMKAYDNGKRDISDQIVGYPEHWSKKKAFQVVEYIDEDEVERRGYKQFLGRPMTDLEWGARGYPEGHRRITVRRVFDKKQKPKWRFLNYEGPKKKGILKIGRKVKK